MAFTWRCEAAGGAALPAGRGADLPGGAFPTQAEAESWLGEEWRELLDRGVDQVTLLEDGQPVYGPMSLHSAT